MTSWIMCNKQLLLYICSKGYCRPVRQSRGCPTLVSALLSEGFVIVCMCLNDLFSPCFIPIGKVWSGTVWSGTVWSGT